LENGCGFFDMVAFQGGPLATVSWNQLDPPYASADHVHLTRRGYERFGEVLLGALVDGFSPPQGAADLRVRPSIAGEPQVDTATITRASR
ncbi:MAG: hypothetical protein H5U40_05305, partial [Polyangiaceae bacterium]|nr:hypothetical protein [Polyangiaceae bacterium]